MYVNSTVLTSGIKLKRRRLVEAVKGHGGIDYSDYLSSRENLPRLKD